MAKVVTGRVFDEREFWRRINSAERLIPPIFEGVDFARNAQLMLGVYEEVRNKPGGSYPPEQEGRLRGMLSRLFGLERVYHAIYSDPAGEKLMHFLFESGDVALLSKAAAAQLGIPVGGGLLTGEDLRVQGRVDEALGSDNFVFLNKGTRMVLDGSPFRESALVVVDPLVMGVKGAAAFNFDDTDTLNKWVRFIERAGEREPNPLPMDEKRRIVRAFMLNPLELDGVRMTIELSSRSMLRMELTKEEKTAFYAEGKYSRWDTVMPFKSASGEIYRNPKAFYRAQLLPVESELFSKILSRRIVISDGVIDRIYNDEDDEFTYPPHITQRAFGEREVIVPEGIGGAFIRKIVVRDDLYPEVARRAQETGLKIGGRDWRDVIVKASDDGKSGWAAEVSNVGNELEEFRER